MRTRLKALGRLAALCEIVEHANGVTLDQSRGALHEVESTIREKALVASRLMTSSEESLRAGELREWQLDRSQIEFSQWNRQALKDLRMRREATMREAAEVYQASRMRLEQIESVLHEVRASVALEEERTEQRAADDRYLSRQRWQIRGDQRRSVYAERSAVSEDIESFEWNG